MFMAFLIGNTQQLPCLFRSNVSTNVKPFGDNQLSGAASAKPTSGCVPPETNLLRMKHTGRQRCPFLRKGSHALSGRGYREAAVRTRVRTHGRESRSRKECRRPGGSPRMRSARRHRTAGVLPCERSRRLAGSREGLLRNGGTIDMWTEDVPLSSGPRIGTSISLPHSPGESGASNRLTNAEGRYNRRLADGQSPLTERVRAQ
jgi:hypothetical protein